ncbi:hypothetical protein [Pseudohaliea rubra]|uniref:hypothetical protein n=1 Tax=Pseudohaliea rubra TaxID=475795 RepID=UPI000553F1BD|nr:hypothetical protein [Pseudohaliea rubra]
MSRYNRKPNIPADIEAIIEILPPGAIEEAQFEFLFGLGDEIELLTKDHSQDAMRGYLVRSAEKFAEIICRKERKLRESE